MRKVTTCVLLLALFGWYLDRVASRELKLIGLGVVGLLVMALMGGMFLAGWLLLEKMRMVRARRIEAEKQAHVTIVTNGGMTWIRDTDHKATWHNISIDPRIYANGSYTEPNAIELQAWQVLNGAKATQAHSPAMLPATTEAEQLDLISVFTQPTQSYAIIGGQQTGKTFQAQHIANYWLRQGIKPVVIGPKWDRGEWGGCLLMGGNGDFEAVEWGIGKIRQLVEKRHADSTKGHKQHRIQPVFFDDWTPIVDAVPNARALVLEATTLYASVNIILYFVLHSDTANAWGVDRKGAALKENFVKLFLVPTYDQAGLIIRSLTQGYIRFAGESVDRPVKLFTTQPISMGEAIEVRPNSAGPDETQARIIHLHKQGQTVSNIAALVYGSKGGPQNKKVLGVLEKYGKV